MSNCLPSPTPIATFETKLLLLETELLSVVQYSLAVEILLRPRAINLGRPRQARHRYLYDHERGLAWERWNARNSTRSQSIPRHAVLLRAAHNSRLADEGKMQRWISLLVAFRAATALCSQTCFIPDEYWQGPEVAHRLVFGYGRGTKPRPSRLSHRRRVTLPSRVHR